MAHARLIKRRDLLIAVAPQLLRTPFENLSLQGVASHCGVSLWALRYAFDNIQGLFNALAYHLFERASEAVRFDAPPSASVRVAIEKHARFLSAAVGKPDFQALLQFLLRNQTHHCWLAEEYERRIANRIVAQLEAAVLASGKRFGATVMLRSDAARHFHKRIEAEFALGLILPPSIAPSAERSDKVLRDIVAETYAATYQVDLSDVSAA
jgi:AcrR family transcriptional regulator